MALISHSSQKPKFITLEETLRHRKIHAVTTSSVKAGATNGKRNYSRRLRYHYFTAMFDECPLLQHERFAFRRLVPVGSSGNLEVT